MFVQSCFYETEGKRLSTAADGQAPKLSVNCYELILFCNGFFRIGHSSSVFRVVSKVVWEIDSLFPHRVQTNART